MPKTIDSRADIREWNEARTERYFPEFLDERGYRPIKANKVSPPPDNPPKGGTNVFTLPAGEK